ncbi:hypothetical protein SASPL_109978 [Salvia splendens]|uniref:Uncharacterized protein n=1 Tax=Salvia splendens TaxID=180675 RepID=A0A8X9A3S7_SALSN|nr:hypothetical protein SASPL_109978 [Salvia splendens]
MTSWRRGSCWPIDLYPSISLLLPLKTQRMYRKLDKLFDSMIDQHKAFDLRRAPLISKGTIWNAYLLVQEGECDSD